MGRMKTKTKVLDPAKEEDEEEEVEKEEEPVSKDKAGGKPESAVALKVRPF